MLCCEQRSVRAYLRPNNSICACSNAGEHYIIFKKNKGGLSCAVLFAVRCGAYPSDKPLTVECLVRSSDGGGVLQSAGSIISFYTKLNILKGEGGNPAHKAVLRAAQRATHLCLIFSACVKRVSTTHMWGGGYALTCSASNKLSAVDAGMRLQNAGEHKC